MNEETENIFAQSQLKVDYVLRWISENTNDWRELQNLAMDTWDSGRGSLGRDDVYWLAKEQNLPVTLCDALHRRDHSLWAGIARYLIKYHPQLEGLLAIKSSVIDVLYPTPQDLPPLTTAQIVNFGQWCMHRKQKAV